jgi:hypothetical protein
MASIDLNLDYKEAQKKIEASKAYKELKSQYDDTVKRAGESFEEKKQDVTKSLNQAKEQQKRFQREIKNQFEQLLDINNVTGGKGSNSIAYVKRLLLKTIKNIEPKLAELLNEESLNAVGCDEQQTFDQQVLYVKVSSIDLINLLKKEPESADGKVLYEKAPIVVQVPPFSMNKELYQLIQTGNPYTVDNGQSYKGASGQNLFDIQYVEFNNIGETGPWYKITLYNRANNINKVGSFLKDYYKTIKVVDFTNIMAYIMESLSGCLSIQANIGITQSEDTSKFAAIIQRVLGLCFDNTKEIDVSGIAKIAELDGIDDSFFELNEVDLRNIEQRITNVKNGVVEFLSCENVKLPVNYEQILEGLNQLNFVEDNDLVAAADSLTETMANNPAWSGFAIDGNIKAELDLNFVKLMVNGIVMSILSPKVLLPIFIMLKSIGNTISDSINSLMDFAKQFRTFFINLSSKIGAIFVQELFNLIKKDIKNLLQSVIQDLAKERVAKKYIMILKLIQLLLVVAEFISDWRRCKSVIDEILWLLKIATSGVGGNSDIPLPLLFGSQLLDGYSETRAFIGAIEELQKLGIPTGPMPDGSPNLDVLKILGQFKAASKEESENGKVQIAIGPLTMTPAGLTVPSSAYGKKI